MAVDIEALGWKGSEKEAVIADAAPSLGLSAQERWDLFASLQRMVGATWAGLDEEEMRRRLEIGEKLEPRPDPWWKNIRSVELP
jgi:hypothetical protein